MKLRNIIFTLSSFPLLMSGLLFGQTPVDTTFNADSVVRVGYITAEGKAMRSVKNTRSDDQIFQFALSPYEVIQGRLPGLMVTAVDGSPYTEYSVINLRNLNFMGLSSPLIVVDGLPLMGEPLEMNPKDIETITFLKDGTHAGMYGGQAASGVLLVTTKKGGDRLSGYYSGGISYSSARKHYDVYSAEEYRKIVTEVWGPTRPVSTWFGNADTDWQDVIFRTGFGQDHFLSLSGPVLKMPFYFSVGKSIRDGVVKTSNYDRTTATLSFTPEFFDSSLSLGVNLKGIFHDNNIASNDAVQMAVIADPTEPVYDSSQPDGYNLMQRANPLAHLEQAYNTIQRNQWLGNLSLDFKIPLVEGLKVSASYGFNITDKNVSIVYDSIASWTQPDGFKSVTKETTDSRFFDASVSYSRTIDALSSVLGAKAGLSDYVSHYEIDNAYGDYIDPDLYGFGSKMTDKRSSLYGSFSWTLLDRYTAKLTFRQDDYSRYAEENRMCLFPSMLFSWDAKKETFLSSDDVFSALKVYTGYSVTGNYQDLGNSDFIIDPELKQEQISSFNLGADFGFLNNRLYGSIEYFNKTGKDIINMVMMLSGSGGNNVLTNFGAIENSGVDFALQTRILSRADLLWEAGLSFYYSKNKISGAEYITADSPVVYADGHPVRSFYFYKQAYNDDGTPIRNVYEDINGDGSVNETDMYFVGSEYPSAMLGLNSTVQFREWDLSFSGRWHMGNYNWNGENAISTYNNLAYRNCFRILNESKLSNLSSQSDYYVENASFFRMDFISLGYKFPELFSEKITIRASAAVQNAFVITGYRGNDPEIAGGAGFRYPRPRTVLMKLSIGF